MKQGSGTADRRVGHGTDRDLADGTRLELVDYLLLIIAAFIGPLGPMAGNHWQLVHPERPLLIGAAIAGIACSAAHLIARRTGSRMKAVFPVLVAVLMLTRAGRLLLTYPVALGWFLALLALAVAWYLGSRLSDGLLQLVSIAAVVALGSGLVVDWHRATSGMGSSNVVRQDPLLLEMTDRPDVYLVVLDGYMGLQGSSEILGESKDEVVARLERLGFQVPKSAWSGYSNTEMSLPSILDMGYPVVPAAATARTSRDLHRMISGWNNTVEVMQTNGYHLTMIESGWVGSACSDAYDTCLQSYWLDSLVFSVAWESMANRLVVAQYGHPFTVNAIHTMRAVKGLQARYRDNGRSDFVFAHVLAPHPPFYLDEECQLVADDERFELSFSVEADGPARDESFLEQTLCVDDFMLDFAESSSESDVVILTADHGVRRHREPDPFERPGDEAILELMNAFVAVRTGSECSLTDPMVTPDLMRQVLSCYSREPLDPVPQRMFLRGGYEMSPSEITELMTSG